ncbi:MAG: serine/threonine-protein kinase, partial [Verrucomicrobia bacterium]|nr:serine/threonine-protein kinase [Verrucomicrobiota bacterium]
DPALMAVPAAPLSLEKPGDRIGRYKLLQKLGEGGCGVVYMAEQQEPVKRRVALKVIKLGMDTQEVIARFEAERQALALMDHPNIAKVLDGGATSTGRPYFVMELVRGTPINRYCDENRLTTRKRLELFILICQAIQHAHQKGVIHRDIKPTNILVADHDGVPVPKVIDFGIAKATAGQTLTDKTLFTAFDQFIGTPAYMSPEQAKLSGLDIDTRSDIYSLGVLLYELLTGRTPFDAKRLIQAGLDEIRRIIQEEDPPRPSTRLSALDAAEQTTVAHQRQTEPPKLTGLVRGDLDWIVMKTLEKDRNRRYETANGLAMDLQRFLSDEPVLARPPSNLYRLQKFVRRNKLAVVATSAVALALLLGLGLSMLLFIRERAARQAAKTEAAKSQQVAQFLTSMLESVGPSVASGRDTKMLQEILDKTAERVGKDLTNQPEVEAELRSTIGEVYNALSQDQKAEAMHRQALALRQKLFGNEHPGVADSLFKLGSALQDGGKLSEAEAMHRSSLAMRKKLFGNEHPDIAQSLHGLADVVLAQGKLTEAEAMYRQSVTMNKKLFGGEHPQVAQSLYGLARGLVDQGKWTEAEKLYREGLAIQRRLLGNDHPDVADTLNSLGWVLQKEGKLAEAEETCRKALTMQKKLLGNEHQKVAASLNNLASVLTMESKLAEAEETYVEAIAVAKKVLGGDHPDVAALLNNLGFLLGRRDKLADAEKTLREALAIHERVQGKEHPQTATALDNLGSVLVYEGKLDEAEKVHRQALAIRKKILGGEHPTVATSLNNIALVLSDQGKLVEAEALYRESLAMRRKLLGNEHPSVAHALEELAIVLRHQGKLADAEMAFRENMDILKEKLPDDWSTFSAISLMGGILLEEKKYAQAEPLLLSGYEGLKSRETKMPVIAKSRLKKCLEQLVQLYEATDSAAKVTEWKKKLAEFDMVEAEKNKHPSEQPLAQPNPANTPSKP